MDGGTHLDLQDGIEKNNEHTNDDETGCVNHFPGHGEGVSGLAFLPFLRAFIHDRG
jgi:hypothetical protein